MAEPDPPLILTVYHADRGTRTKVATVNCWHLPLEEALTYAFEMTVDDDGPWCFREGVIAEPGFHRSSRSGDIIAADGTRFRLLAGNWIDIGPAGMQPFTVMLTDAQADFLHREAAALNTTPQQMLQDAIAGDIDAAMGGVTP